MRVPLPAAGMMPHMPVTSPPRQLRTRSRKPRSFRGRGGAAVCSASVRSRARRAIASRSASDSAIAASVSSVCRRDEDLASRLEEGVQPLPGVADDRRAAGGGLEQPPGRTPAHARHRVARDVQGEPRRAVERRMGGGRHMPDEPDIVRPGEILRVLRAADDEAVGRTLPGGSTNRRSTPPDGRPRRCRDRKAPPRNGRRAGPGGAGRDRPSRRAAWRGGRPACRATRRERARRCS